jgi:hypothetical protein
MDLVELRSQIRAFVDASRTESERFERELQERAAMVEAYNHVTSEKLLAMEKDGLYEYLAPLWAMRIWGNKQYVIDKLVDDNGLDALRTQLASLVWGKGAIGIRWDAFRKKIKGMGPAMMSEILCKTHPKEFMLWNRRAFVGLKYLQVDALPRYDYQLTGKVYEGLCSVTSQIAKELADAGFPDTTLLAVDYFIWDRLQVEDNLSRIHAKKDATETIHKLPLATGAEFIHDDVRDKLRDIGEWLGLKAETERKVAEGSKVDTVWEATIGNMGRVIYVFEVQTKGSIDSLIINLLKSLNNPAVQGVVAVSDKNQLERIRNEVEEVKELRDKVRYWDYENVLKVHEGLEFVNESINELGLVPQGFLRPA